MNKTLGEVIKELQERGIKIGLISLSGRLEERGYVSFEDYYRYTICITDLRNDKTVADIACFPEEED